MDVDTRLLRAFLAVAEEGHVTRAAQRLMVAQPALSKQLRRLEDQLGARLFDRDAHGVTLTTAGVALEPVAREVLASWTGAERRVRTAARTGMPQVVVGFIANAATEFTPRITHRFAALRPGWRAHLQQSDWSDPTAGLDSGTSDVALLRLPVPDSGQLRFEPLFSEPMCLALPSSHRLARKRDVSMEDLLDEPFVATRGPAAWRDWWLAADQRQGRPPVIGALVGTPDEWLHAILNGEGVSFAFASAARYYAPPGLTYRFIDGLPPSTVAVGHRHDTHNPAVDDFVLACRQATSRPKLTETVGTDPTPARDGS